MDFSSLFNIFEKHGMTGVVIVVFGAIIILLAKWLYKNITSNLDNGMEKIATKITDNMSIQNQLLIDTVNSQNEKMLNYIINKENIKTEKHNEMLNERMDTSAQISEKLKDILYANGADRISIFEFHNSFQNLVGVPFAKYSCTFEWFKPGIQSIQTKIQAMPFSSISLVVKDILNNGGRQIKYDSIKCLEQGNPVLYSLLKTYKVNAVIYNALYDSKNNMIGLLAIEYHHSSIPNNINYEEIKIDAAQITSILNLRYKYSEN